jgi:predicted phage baseplate assembly protein
MTILPPNIDQRTANDIALKVRDLIKVYAPDWKEFDPVTGQPTGVSGALIGIFARFAEITIQRLNQTPQKNFLAFLDLLGASLLAPQPARVPLTFFLAAGSAVDGLVPAGTQAAAPPLEGEKDPVIFETERELVVTAAQLASLFARDPEQDKYGDDSAIIASPAATGVPIFQGLKRIEHILYIGHNRLLGFPQINNLRLTFTLATLPPSEGGLDARTLKWEFWDGTQWQDRTPTPLNDPTSGLQLSGTIDFGSTDAIPASTINLVENRWLRCRLLTPITQSSERQHNMIRAAHLPQIQAIQMSGVVNRTGLTGEQAFTNLLPVDLTKGFLPFGEKPKFSDTFYLTHRESLSAAGALITLTIDVANPVPVSAPPPPPPSNDLRLVWEVWNGSKWIEMGTSTPTGEQTPAANEFDDTTNALTKSGFVRFRLPTAIASTIVNGVENFWLRVRIASGNYGVEARYDEVTPTPENPTGFNFVAATFRPPILNSIKVGYNLNPVGAPEAVQTFNNFLYRRELLTSTFAPFTPVEDVKPAFYLGFTLPPNRTTFPNRTISLFAAVAGLRYGELAAPISPESSKRFGAPASAVSHQFLVTNASAGQATFTFGAFGGRWLPASAPPLAITLEAEESKEIQVQVTVPLATPLGTSDRRFLKLEISTEPDVEYAADLVTIAGLEAVQGERLRLVWEYWNGRGWSVLTVRDETENFTRPGLIEFLAPRDFASHEEFGQPSRYWLRVRWEKGEFALAPRLRRMLLNTTMAAQTVTLRNEILGSSDGSSGQKFRTTQSPVLPGPRLEVREPEMPSAAELEVITREEGEDAITIISDAAGRPKEIWVRWHEAPDFYASGTRSRHYVIDHLAGEIRFGDGLNGLIPPIGAGNIRLARYQIGGGKVGNRAEGTIVQLKTTVPYVDKVINTEAAAGGADAETTDSLITRSPRTIRHGGRAITVEDYEDLAMLASPAVARAKCVPLRDLVEDPLGEQPKTLGEVSVIIVPRSTEAKPLPSLELLSRVQDYLEAQSIPTSHVSVVGPLYVRVDVTLEISLVSLEGATAVEQAIQQRLAGFLHPLTGGLDGAGWDFGRKPHRSDMYALIEAVPGVDHIRSLSILETDDQLGVSATRRFLVFSGTHTISFVFEEE